MVVNPKIWQKIFERDKGICKYCDFDLLSSFATYWVATVDHIKHRSDDGDDSDENLVLACPACNGMLSRSKDKTTIEERRKFVQQRIKDEHQGYMEWVHELRK